MCNNTEFVLYLGTYLAKVKYKWFNNIKGYSITPVYIC